VLMAAQERLVGVADIMGRGLTYNIPGGLGKTVLGYQDASDIEDAELRMDGQAPGQRDRAEFDINYLPLPIIFKDFSFSIREIKASRNGNMPLDTTNAELAARKVAEKVEEVLFQGASAYTFGGGTIRGLQDAPQRNQGSLTFNWDDSGAIADRTTILDDVLAMKAALIADYHYGPYGLYVATEYETALDDDFKANSDRTVRERILAVDSLSSVKVADKMTSDQVLMVQLTSDVVRMVQGLPITTVQWETEGGMRVWFKVMTILVPQIRNDQNNRSGVAHWT